MCCSLIITREHDGQTDRWMDGWTVNGAKYNDFFTGFKCTAVGLQAENETVTSLTQTTAAVEGVHQCMTT